MLSNIWNPEVINTSMNYLFYSFTARMRRYIIENCKDKDKVEDIKKEKKIRMQRW